MCEWWEEEREKQSNRQEGTEKTCNRVKGERDEEMLDEVAAESAVTAWEIV